LILFLSVLMGSSDQIKLPENCMTEETLLGHTVRR
jgi:hypothetical protein